MEFRRLLLGEFETNAVLLVGAVMGVALTGLFRPFFGGVGYLTIAWLVLFPLGTCGATFAHLRWRVRAGHLGSARARVLLERVPYLFLFFWGHSSIWRTASDYGVIDLEKHPTLGEFLAMMVVFIATAALLGYGWAGCVRWLLARWPFQDTPHA